MTAHTSQPGRDPVRRRSRRLCSLALVSALLVLAPVTAASCSCPAALLPGVLVAQDSELSIKEDTGGFVRPIRWPFGYGVGREPDGLILTDILGNMKAREGDHVSLPGGEISSNGPWGVCGEIQIDS